MSEKQAAIVAETVVSQRVIKRIDTLVTEALLKAFFSDDALRAIYREKAAKISGAGAASVALLAAIRSTIAGVRPKLQKLVLETVGVKPFLAAGFGTQSGRVHSEFRQRYLRLTRANGWLRWARDLRRGRPDGACHPPLARPSRTLCWPFAACRRRDLYPLPRHHRRRLGAELGGV